ncbi:hypothetical protein MKZ38_000489 [Zalerion maritima]|uniref:Uncharacterized protein n=1 Tax=Zalerion maritima TaxID=339359 RepID=A0AAD5RSV0_9PEZI|nr:hypothetical protein MKZ38_000489 [Zalerion maritima]
MADHPLVPLSGYTPPAPVKVSTTTAAATTRKLGPLLTPSPALSPESGAYIPVVPRIIGLVVLLLVFTRIMWVVLISIRLYIGFWMDREEEFRAMERRIKKD